MTREINSGEMDAGSALNDGAELLDSSSSVPTPERLPENRIGLVIVEGSNGERLAECLDILEALTLSKTLDGAHRVVRAEDGVVLAYRGMRREPPATPQPWVCERRSWRRHARRRTA